MPLREKIKSLLHRHDDETTPPNSPGRQSRYEVAPQAVSPQQGERPTSGTGTQSQQIVMKIGHGRLTLGDRSAFASFACKIPIQAAQVA